MNDTTQPGYLTPTSPVPQYDQALEREISRWIRGVSGLPDGMAMSRFTDPQPAIPALGTNWCGFNISDFQDAANPAAIAEVVEWRDYYHMAKRMPLHQALKEAVKRVAPAYAKAATPPQGIAGPSGADRTQAQRMANAKASAQLPPSTAQAGIGERANRAAKMDIGKMSDAEFDSLSADERAKLRGDAMA